MSLLEDFLNDPNTLYERTIEPEAELFWLEENLAAESLARPIDAVIPELMEQAMSGPMLPVPGLLLEIAARVTSGADPVACVIELRPEDTMKAFVSATLGYMLTENMMEPVRSSVAERRPAVQVQQRSGDFEYQIIRESEREVMIAVRIKRAGVLRASLRKEGRIIASRTLPPDDRSIAFEHLDAGVYYLEFAGTSTTGFSFQISASS